VTFPKIPWLLVGAGIVLMIFAGLEIRSARSERARQKLERQLLEAKAKELGGIVGQLQSERAITKKLSQELQDFVAAMKKTVPKARIESRIGTTVRVEDTPAGAVVETPSGPSEWRDEYHRFRLELPSGPFHRKQLFRVDTVVVRSPDGKSRVSKSAFKEYDPETETVIPSTGVTLEGNLDFVEEPKVAPPIIHPRLVAGIDIQGSPGAGLEILNLERTYWPALKKLTVSLIGYWDRKAGEGRGVAQVGYRVLNSNVTVGPYAGVSTSGAFVVGAGAAIQVTR